MATCVTEVPPERSPAPCGELGGPAPAALRSRLRSPVARLASPRSALRATRGQQPSAVPPAAEVPRARPWPTWGRQAGVDDVMNCAVRIDRRTLDERKAGVDSVIGCTPGPWWEPPQATPIQKAAWWRGHRLPETFTWESTLLQQWRARTGAVPTREMRSRLCSDQGNTRESRARRRSASRRFSSESRSEPGSSRTWDTVTSPRSSWSPLLCGGRRDRGA